MPVVLLVVCVALLRTVPLTARARDGEHAGHPAAGPARPGWARSSAGPGSAARRSSPRSASPGRRRSSWPPRSSRSRSAARSASPASSSASSRSAASSTAAWFARHPCPRPDRAIIVSTSCRCIALVGRRARPDRPGCCWSPPSSWAPPSRPSCRRCSRCGCASRPPGCRRRCSRTSASLRMTAFAIATATCGWLLGWGVGAVIAFGVALHLASLLLGIALGPAAAATGALGAPGADAAAPTAPVVYVSCDDHPRAPRPRRQRRVPARHAGRSRRGCSRTGRARYVQLATAAAPEGDRVLARWHDLGRPGGGAARASSRSSSTCARARMPTTPAHAEAIAGAGLIYLSGGNPGHLAQHPARHPRVGRDPRGLARRARHWPAAVPGAMALGGYVPDFRHPKRGGTDGLGVVPDLRVLPHFDKYSRMIPDFALQAARHDGCGRRRDRRGHRPGVGGPVARTACGSSGHAVGSPRGRSRTTAGTASTRRCDCASTREPADPARRPPAARAGRGAAPGHPHLQAAAHPDHRAGVARHSSSRRPSSSIRRRRTLDLAGDLGRRRPRHPRDRVRRRTGHRRDGRGRPGDRRPRDRRPHPRRRRPAGPHRRGGPHQRAGDGGRRARRAQPHGARSTRSPACAPTSPTRGRRPVITSAGSSSPRSLDLVRSRLVPGGTWHIATDWDEYARRGSQACFAADARWHGGVVDRPAWRPGDPLRAASPGATAAPSPTSCSATMPHRLTSPVSTGAAMRPCPPPRPSPPVARLGSHRT